MTTWLASVGDILDVSADALICSANPQLNLSGGVGGAFGLRYGNAMQQFLHGWLVEHRRPFIEPGQIVIAPACGSPFKMVVHAVAVDAFYDTSAASISSAYERSFAAIAEAGYRTVAAACLGCGYGRMSSQSFVAAIAPLLKRDMPGIERVELVSTNGELVDTIRSAIAHRA